MDRKGSDLHLFNGLVKNFASEYTPLTQDDPRLPELRGQAPGNGKDNTP